MRVPSETVFAVGFPARTDGYWIAGLLVSTIVMLQTHLTMLAVPVWLFVTFVWCVRSGYRRPNVVPAALIGALGLMSSITLFAASFSLVVTSTLSTWRIFVINAPSYGFVALVGIVYGTVGHVLGRALQL